MNWVKPVNINPGATMTAVSKGFLSIAENWIMTKNPPDISIAQATVPVMKFRCHGERRIRTDQAGQRSGTFKPMLNWIGHPRIKVSARNHVL